MTAVCGITLYHASVDEESRTETYQKTYFPKASVYQQVSMDTRRSKNGPWPEWETVIRIPTEEKIDIALGDRLVLGCSSEESPPEKSMQVCGFADNRRGSRNVWHWKVVCR